MFNSTFKKTARRVASLVLLYSLFFCHGAYAHNRSQSFSIWEMTDNKIQMTFTVKSREATRLAYLPEQSSSLENILIQHVQDTVSVTQAQRPCPTTGQAKALPANTGFIRIVWVFECQSNQDIEIKINSFFDVAPAHVHYAQVLLTAQSASEQSPTDQLTSEQLTSDQLSSEQLAPEQLAPEQSTTQYLFTDRQRQHLIQHNKTTNLSTRIYHLFAQYTTLGVSHIFMGIDHIVFLLALLLLCRRLKDLIWLISGFSIGHSISLILASFGILTPQVSIIEALIGFTIVLVSLEKASMGNESNKQSNSLKLNSTLRISCVASLLVLIAIQLIWQQGLPVLSLVGLIIVSLSYFPYGKSQTNSLAMRGLLTLAFGLIHGFGFANVLNEIGLPTQQLFTALLGFNLGVEIGQLMIVGLIYFVLKTVSNKRWVTNTQSISNLSVALLFGLGLYWFIVRSFISG